MPPTKIRILPQIQDSKQCLKSHWNHVYDNCAIDKLGWFEKIPEPSIRLIRLCELPKNARILNVGVGASTLVDELIKMGFANIMVNDLSPKALEILKSRIGEENNIEWIVDDLSKPAKLNRLDPVDLWHDRAVLHFFVQEEQQDAYFKLLKALVKLGGYVIIATFNLSGATKCSGLPVYRYNADMLSDQLGADFTLMEAFDDEYRMPSGDQRAYVYTLFKRNEEL